MIEISLKKVLKSILSFVKTMRTKSVKSTMSYMLIFLSIFVFYKMLILMKLFGKKIEEEEHEILDEEVKDQGNSIMWRSSALLTNYNNHAFL